MICLSWKNNGSGKINISPYYIIICEGPHNYNIITSIDRINYLMERHILDLFRELHIDISLFISFIGSYIYDDNTVSKT